MPRISIIIAVYNNKRYFPSAVESVLNQGYQDFEIIIIDDGSTDGTGLLADEIAKTDERIKVIHQDNQWIYASFNRGIKEATGEYVYILNSDDKLRPGTLKIMDGIIEKYNPDVIWTKVLYHICDSEQRILSYDFKNHDRMIQEDRYYSNETEVRNAWPFFFESYLAYNQANLYRRNIINKYSFRNDILMADILINTCIAPDVKTAYIMKEPVYDFLHYNQDKLNASAGKYYEHFHEMYTEVFGETQHLFEKWGLPENQYIYSLAKRRLSSITHELRSLQASNCPLNTNEKIEKVLYNYIDETVYGYAYKANMVEELESRILSGIREILVKETLDESSRYYFMYELLVVLLRYEKTEQDYEIMNNAINHYLNPFHVGQVFFNKLLNNKMVFINER